jgi:hypothetical protein
MFVDKDARMKSDGTTSSASEKAWQRAKKSSGQRRPFSRQASEALKPRRFSIRQDTEVLDEREN